MLTGSFAISDDAQSYRYVKPGWSQLVNTTLSRALRGSPSQNHSELISDPENGSMWDTEPRLDWVRLRLHQEGVRKYTQLVRPIDRCPRHDCSSSRRSDLRRAVAHVQTPSLLSGEHTQLQLVIKCYTMPSLELKTNVQISKPKEFLAEFSKASPARR